MIRLPYGGPGVYFDEHALIDHIRDSGRDYIIQGQTNCTLDRHPKPQSLDVWLRQGLNERQDTKQAVNSVIDDLVVTGLFTFHNNLICPNSGQPCKSIRLVGNRGRP